jgi:Gas vesicle synthesis protein GvpL/GvpF
VRLKQSEGSGRSHSSVARGAVIGRSLKANSSAARSRRVSSTAVAPVRDQVRRRATGKYVYCIARAMEQTSYGPIGLGAEPADVYTIARGELAAVVSDAPLEVLDPTRDNVLAHQRVNETVMKQHTVLPMSFGTVFKTHDDVVELLRSASDAFSDVLNKMEAKIEFGLKVVWDRDAIVREIEQEDEDIRRVKAELQTRKGSTYFARMQFGRLVDAALQAKSERYVADIFAALRGASVAARSNKLIGERMILNAAFLVNRRDAREFDRCVKALGERDDKLTYKYTGPWPPYNFVNIRLKLERA